MPASRKAIDTGRTTTDDLIVYDLDPQAFELWAVAGPPGFDPTLIDPDALPTSFRWIDDAEWGEIATAKPAKRTWIKCESKISSSYWVASDDDSQHVYRVRKLRWSRPVWVRATVKGGVAVKSSEHKTRREAMQD